MIKSFTVLIWDVPNTVMYMSRPEMFFVILYVLVIGGHSGHSENIPKHLGSIRLGRVGFGGEMFSALRLCLRPPSRARRGPSVVGRMCYALCICIMHMSRRWKGPGVTSGMFYVYCTVLCSTEYMCSVSTL